MPEPDSVDVRLAALEMMVRHIVLNTDIWKTDAPNLEDLSDTINSLYPSRNDAWKMEVALMVERRIEENYAAKRSISGRDQKE